ncbi:MAG TPA: O-antigen ligase family protein [Patescibacteria group bacterium]|nr:O-antigen ligase family protein [Patescibacteria group bacterium]
MSMPTARTFEISRERPHLAVAGLAAFLLLCTVLLGISIPTMFLGMLILAAAVGTLIRPEIGLHVLVFNAMVGLTHVVDMPRVGPVSVPVLIEFLVLGAILFQTAFLRKRVAIGTAQHTLLGFLAIWVLLSVMTGVMVGPENFRQYRNLFLVRLIMFLIVGALVTTIAQARRVVVTFMVSNLGLLCVAAAVRLGYFGQEKITISQEFERTGALVQNPNELAFNLTTMLVLSIFAFLYVRGRRLKVLLFGLAAADLFFTLSTLSRSGFICLCIVLMFLFFKLTGNLRAVAVMLLLALCGWLMIPDQLFARFSRIDEVKDVDRLQLASVGLAMTTAHPLLGVGMGNYVPLFWDYNTSHMKRAAPSHNMYLDLTAQMGVPSLLIYLAVIGVTWRGLRRMERDLKARGALRSFEYLFGLAIQGFFVNLAVFGLSGDVEFDYSAFVLLGLAMVIMQQHRVKVGASGRN